ncbi:hypothetical protein Bbelb_373710 [Branchiostoma belcheri]|nr:hypothetical protein Bbelb_373710 [Branchiostoma belcheri]
MSGNDIEMHTRNPNPMYTRNNTNPYPMDAQNDINPNPMYLQSTIEPNVSSGPTRVPNLMYTRNTLNPCPMNAQNTDTDTENDVNPNPMYLQTPVEPPNATTRSDDNEDIPCAQASADAHQQGDEVNFSPDDNHCLQAYAVTRLQDDESSSIIMTEDNTVAYMCQDDVVCSIDDHTRPFLQNEPTAASNNINDAPIAPNPNPMSDGDEDISCTQASADAHLQGDEANLSPANNDDNHCLQLYAVTHQEEAAPTTSIVSDDEDIQPYDAAYTCQGNILGNAESQNQPAAASNNPDDNNDALNALNQNSIYVPNVQHRSACEANSSSTDRVQVVACSSPATTDLHTGRGEPFTGGGGQKSAPELPA